MDGKAAYRIVSKGKAHTGAAMEMEPVKTAFDPCGILQPIIVKSSDD